MALTIGVAGVPFADRDAAVLTVFGRELGEAEDKL